MLSTRFFAALVFGAAAVLGCDFYYGPHRYYYGDDIHENNDTLSAASLLADDLMVGDSVDVISLAGYDDDWFEIVTLEKSDLTVRLTQDRFYGDMDLFVFDGSGVLLGSSVSSGNTDKVTVVGAFPGTYFILAQPYSTQPDYDLRITLATSSIKPRMSPPALDPDGPSE